MSATSRQAAAIEAAAADAGIRMTVLVEIDVGAARCGVPAGPEAVALAQRIAASKHLRFGGLQAYQGSAQHKRTVAERRTLIDGAIDASRRTVEQLRQQGLDCPIVGGAGTGTFQLEAASGVYTEMQAGSYVFMDADYARNVEGYPGLVVHGPLIATLLLNFAENQVAPGRFIRTFEFKALRPTFDLSGFHLHATPADRPDEGLNIWSTNNTGQVGLDGRITLAPA